MKLSYVIVTHNRRERLLKTLSILRQSTPLPRDQWETWVVDNASTDGTLEALNEQFPEVNLIQRHKNEGVWARSYAFSPANGEYLILLDDDSYPVGDAASRSIEYLDVSPRCAAVVGKVILSDGSLEACALPSVMLSGAVCLRKSVLNEVGGFRREFFRKAGEYDLSFRIWQAGYSVERFEDIVYRHDKVMGGRSAAFAHRMDLRNNLILVERYLPTGMRSIYRDDWTQRYAAIAAKEGFSKAIWHARAEAKLWRLREAITGRQTMGLLAVETIFQWQTQALSIAYWAWQYRPRRVAIADFSKNIYATYRGCREADLEITSIIDSNPAFAGMSYRGIPIKSEAEALHDQIDGVVLSNVNPAQVDRKLAQLATKYSGPILRLWRPRNLPVVPAIRNFIIPLAA